MSFLQGAMWVSEILQSFLQEHLYFLFFFFLLFVEEHRKSQIRWVLSSCTWYYDYMYSHKRCCSHSYGSHVKSRKCYLNVLKVAILTRVYCGFNNLIQQIVSWHIIFSQDVFSLCSEIWAHCGYNNNKKINKLNLNK